MNIAYANILQIDTWTGQQYFHLALPALPPEVNVLTSMWMLFMSILSLGPSNYVTSLRLDEQIWVMQHGHRALIQGKDVQEVWIFLRLTLHSEALSCIRDHLVMNTQSQAGTKAHSQPKLCIMHFS